VPHAGGISGPSTRPRDSLRAVGRLREADPFRPDDKPEIEIEALDLLPLSGANCAVTVDQFEGERVRDALVRQWREIARAIPSRDLETASRVDGWRNREVVAHLAMQPVLLVKFLATAGSDPPRLRAEENLSGTRNLAELVDAATRQAATDDKLDFAGAAENAIACLAVADLAATITTVQGPILLRDYLVTRCVEAVVHGGDLVDPVEPDRDALDVAADVLMSLLATRDPHLLATAAALPRVAWVAIATGRKTAPTSLASVVPLMS